MKLHVELISTGLYTGYLPGAPGTWGSWSAGAAFFILASMVPAYSASVALLGAVVLFFLGLWTAGEAALQSKRKDPSFVVIDEWAGQFLTYIFIAPDLINLLLGFILFRFFDIIKIWPIHRFEEFSGSLGIMLDDIAAGIYAAITLWLINFVFR